MYLIFFGFLRNVLFSRLILFGPKETILHALLSTWQSMDFKGCTINNSQKKDPWFNDFSRFIISMRTSWLWMIFMNSHWRPICVQWSKILMPYIALAEFYKIILQKFWRKFWVQNTNVIYNWVSDIWTYWMTHMCIQKWFERSKLITEVYESSKN